MLGLSHPSLSPHKRHRGRAFTQARAHAHGPLPNSITDHSPARRRFSALVKGGLLGSVRALQVPTCGRDWSCRKRWSEQPDVTDAMQRMAVPGLPSDIALDRHHRASAQRCSLSCKLCGGHGGQPCWAADLSALQRWWWSALCMCSSPLVGQWPKRSRAHRVLLLDWSSPVCIAHTWTASFSLFPPIYENGSRGDQWTTGHLSGATG